MEHNWDKYFDTTSDYWVKLQALYAANEHYPKKVVTGRNLHHKFLRSWSKKDGTAIDNDENNLVSLSLSDHFLAHYYIWKCSLKGYRRMTARSFQLMRKKAVTYCTDETVEMIAKDYAEAMGE